MKVLVTGASKHGATHDIVDVIARALSDRGLDVVDRPINEIDEVAAYDAVILGSAVYVGRWMPEATAFVSDHLAQLALRPVWLFSSGPIGDPPKPIGDPSNVAELVAAVSARGHRVFAGRLDSDRLGLGEKLIVGALHAPKGDFRDFAQVEAWANEIADVLAAENPRTTVESADSRRQALLFAARR